MSDPFWFNDFKILFDKDRLIEFFPTKDQNHAEQLNAIVRLALYISIIVYLLNSDTTYFMYAIIVALFTVLLYKNDKQKENLKNTDGKYQNENCTKPTIENPFMNFTMNDYMNIKDGKTVDKPEACDPTEPDIKKDIDDKFNNNLYRDVDDVFGKMNSQRQFFTMPWTSNLPDENGDFKNWLYKSPKTCKEDSDYCLNYEDVRQKVPIFVNPDINPEKINK